MESQHKQYQDLSPRTKQKNKETDSSISLTFDSESDCGYKSGEISSVLSTSEQISNLSLTDSSSQLTKSDQNVSYDSGLVTDSSSSIISESYSSEKLDNLQPPKPLNIKEKYLWHDIFSQDKDGDTILHLAIVEARSDIIFPLIRLAPHPDFLDISNDLYQTMLHLAVLTGKSNIVRRLVVAGATLDVQDHGGNIPLHIACRSGDLDCVRAMLTPVIEAEISVAQCSYQMFLQNQDLSYLINMKNFDGQSCVHLAAAGGFLKVMECLNNHHANIDDQDGKTGRTALHYAIENGNYRLVELLLKKCRADPHVQNYAGKTAFCVAWALRKRNHIHIRDDIMRILKIPPDYRDESDDEESDYSSGEIDIEVLLQNSKNSLSSM
ncbi:NF-kappa-B inhibitor cactus [Parasteatoda tepidariorum]|uniref:NF-kappa-B inhibitor cactus n=1 Tax=Parasteatoda tepidariorum TaxID=114398 RepID=UPI001C7215C9|nr:NF-kappa-B inhibitor cactus [Parasteatoda tepidariorum]